MRRPRCATSSPVLGPRVPTEPPVGPTVACTAARASGLMAARWGASSPSPGTDRAGPSEPSPANGDVIGPVVPGPSSAAQCISGGSADDDTARIWPVWMGSVGGIRPVPRNGDASSGANGLGSGDSPCGRLNPGPVDGPSSGAGVVPERGGGEGSPPLRDAGGTADAGGGAAGAGRPRPDRSRPRPPLGEPGRDAADGADGGGVSAEARRGRGRGPGGRPWPLPLRADGGGPSGPTACWGPVVRSDCRQPARGTSPAR